MASARGTDVTQSSAPGIPAGGWYADPTGRFQYRYWNGAAWTSHVASGGVQTLDEPSASWPTQPQAPTPVVEAGANPLSPVVVRRVFWNLYAVPVTLLYATSSIVEFKSGNPWMFLDAAVSIPQLIALHLHIWDKRTLNGLVWKIYAFGFLVWQIAFGFFISPPATGAFSVASLIGTAIQLPMMVALFLYAFRRWPDSSDARETQRSGGRLIVLSATAVFLVVVALLVFVYLQFGHLARSVAGGIGRVPTYRVSTPPPRVPAKVTTNKRVSLAARARLRALLRQRDFEALNRELGAIQAQADSNPSAEYMESLAFGLFESADYLPALNAWVSRDPSNYVARLARADYYYSAGWDARGSDWASNTSAKQFADMNAAFARAKVDLDAATRSHPRLLLADLIRISIEQAGGTRRSVESAIAAGESDLPHSFQLYDTVENAQLPRWGGSYEEMERTARQAVKQNPGDPRFYALFGEIYLDEADRAWRAGDTATALAYFNDALAYGETYEALYSRADLNYKEGRSNLAMQDIDEELALAPNDVPGHLFRATLLLDLKDLAGARSELATAQAIAPDDPDIADWLKRERSRLGVQTM